MADDSQAPSAAPGDAAGYLLAYEEGKSAIGEQAITLKETRDRAGTVVSAAAVVAALGTNLAFGGVRTEEITTLGAAGGAIAMAGFILVAVSSVSIWRPFKGVFVRDPATIVGSYVEGDSPALLPEIHRELALHLGNHIAANRSELDRRLLWFTISLVAFVAEIGGLALMVMDVRL